MTKVSWNMVHSSDVPRTVKMAKRLNVPYFIAKLLVNRGVKTVADAEKFLNPNIHQFITDLHLNKVDQLHDIKKGTDEIRRAIRKGDKITIYGDYDVDGITSTSIMYLLLKYFKADVHYFIPNRFKDGYGPNMDEYKRIIKGGTKLLITVDNGIAGLKEVTYAEKHGMHVIITDHHGFPKKLPPADAIIMAAYPTHKFHFTDFCGVGIAFMIATYMLKRIPTDWLDIAALGTVADSVALRQENRTIVKFGVKELQHSRRTGIMALARVADTDLAHLTAHELSFSLIPRLNSLGRMADATIGVKLMTTNDPNTAMKIARETEHENSKRKTLMKQQVAEAIKQASSPANRKRCTLVLVDKHWHTGLVGIIASQVQGKFFKPTLVVGHVKGKDVLTGSGRSIPGFNLFTAMKPLKDKGIMTSFGGHPFACGFSIKPDKIKDLRDGLEKAGREQGLNAHEKPQINLDLSLTPKQVNTTTFNDLKMLEPFGENNELPMIDLKMPTVYNPRQVGQGNDLNFTLSSDYRNSIHVIAFGFGDKYNSIIQNPHYIELAGFMGLNYYRNNVYLQFSVKHMRRYTPLLRQIYIHLFKRRTVQGSDYKSLLQKIGRDMSLDTNKIDIAIKTFSDLGFLKLTNANHRCSLEINLNPTAQDLGNSLSYQEYGDYI